MKATLWGLIMDKLLLYIELQKLRRRLHEIAESRSLTDPEVIAISEAADELIVAIQQIQLSEQNVRSGKKQV
jgi:hypothetical protein